MTEQSPPEKAAVAEGTAQVEARAYNAFIAGLELQQIRLSAAEINAPTAPQQRMIAPVIHTDDAEYRNEGGHFVVSQTLRFSGTYEGETDIALRVRVTYEVRYTAAEPMNDGIFAEFRHRNLPVNVWPYFREYLQSTLCRVGWPVLTLPALRRAPGPGPSVSDEVGATGD